MTHYDKGHYAAKHPAGTQVEPAIHDAVKEKLDKRTITCHAAHKIAEKLNVSPKQVGIAIDLQEGRIHKCQLGLFGYGSPQKAIKPSPNVSPQVKAAIESALINDRLPCIKAWEIAQSQGISRRTVAEMCETLGIRINQCQLGAF